MKKICKYGVIALCVITSVMTTGCISKKKKVDESSNTKQALNRKMNKKDIKDGKITDNAILLSIGDKDVSFSEAMVYVMLYKSNYDDLLSDDIWSYKVEKNRSFEQVSKECIINQIVTSKIIEYGAETLGVTVEPDEKIEIEDKAIECYEDIFEDLDGKYGITKSVVKDVLYDNFLAEKVYEVATNDVKVSVKKSESKVPTVKQIYISYNSVLTRDKDATKEDKKKVAYDKICSIKEKIDEDGDNFTSIAGEYSETDELDVEVTCETKDKSYRKAALSLKEDELSEVIECSDGYYVLYCVNENDEDLMKENEEKIIKLRQDDIFSAKYDKWLKDYDVYIVSELWNKMEIGKM